MMVAPEQQGRTGAVRPSGIVLTASTAKVALSKSPSSNQSAEHAQQVEGCHQAFVEGGKHNPNLQKETVSWIDMSSIHLFETVP